MKKVLRPLLLAVAFGAAAAMPAAAQSQASPAVAPTVAAADMSDAEVRKIDVENKKITLKHGEIRNLDMPAMTMVFHVADAAVLNKLKAGDKVRFKAVNDAGKFTVTEIQPVR